LQFEQANVAFEALWPGPGGGESSLTRCFHIFGGVLERRVEEQENAEVSHLGVPEVQDEVDFGMHSTNAMFHHRAEESEWYSVSCR
jgi:hypothetical protein